MIVGTDRVKVCIDWLPESWKPSYENYDGVLGTRVLRQIVFWKISLEFFYFDK